MSDLFSHAAAEPANGSPNESLPPDREVTVAVPVSMEHAFAGFVDNIHLWWPAEYTNFGPGTHPEFTDGVLLEEGDDGDTYEWARITTVQPPVLLELSWTMGGTPAAPTRLVLSFAEDAGLTRLSLVHNGWAQGQEGRDQYQKYGDWPVILGRYRRFMGGSR
ncbi:SRPBCC domain-containing protein [Arthrobacter sp. H5]|uniref:SRPBCC domain-containing protein n=1 Tax=Arthrobacter sp. H5 TaxID=1267973 RepID=UPI000483CCBF|nr:SRPBCC domain-containing protein [Arthrobacter sp. H5]